MRQAIHIFHKEFRSYFVTPIAYIVIAIFLLVTGWFAIPLAVFGVLALIGIYDLRQNSHSILRNYPILGHMRFLQSIRCIVFRDVSLRLLFLDAIPSIR